MMFCCNMMPFGILRHPLAPDRRTHDVAFGKFGNWLRCYKLLCFRTISELLCQERLPLQEGQFIEVMRGPCGASIAFTTDFSHVEFATSGGTRWDDSALIRHEIWPLAPHAAMPYQELTVAQWRTLPKKWLNFWPISWVPWSHAWAKV